MARFNAAVTQQCKGVLERIIAAVVQREAFGEAIATEARVKALRAASQAAGAATTTVAAAQTARGCGCDGCESAPPGAILLTNPVVNKMTTAVPRRAELIAHGKEEAAAAAAPAQKAALKELVGKKALFLTRSDADGRLGATARARDDSEGVPITTADEPPTTTRPVTPASPPQRAKRLAVVPSPVWSSPLAPRRPAPTTRGEESPMAMSPTKPSRLQRAAPAEFITDMAKLWRPATQHKVAGYVWACDAILHQHLLLHAEYSPTAVAHGVYVLRDKEFSALVEGLFCMASSVLDEWLDVAVDVAEAAYAAARRSKRSYKWPQYAGAGKLLQADACFQVKCCARARDRSVISSRGTVARLVAWSRSRATHHHHRHRAR